MEAVKCTQFVFPVKAVNCTLVKWPHHHHYPCLELLCTESSPQRGILLLLNAARTMRPAMCCKTIKIYGALQPSRTTVHRGIACGYNLQSSQGVPCNEGTAWRGAKIQRKHTPRCQQCI